MTPRRWRSTPEERDLRLRILHIDCREVRVPGYEVGHRAQDIGDDLIGQRTWLADAVLLSLLQQWQRLGV